MNRFWIKPARLVRLLFRHFTWRINTNQKTVFLTFDDGPTPEITTWTLDRLREYGAKATFFCIGSNVRQFPQIVTQIVSEGHSIGNHTNEHVLGWQTDNQLYYRDCAQCDDALSNVGISTKLFRPPYGKIKKSQSKDLRKLGYKIIMWDVLSADYEVELSPQQCLGNVTKNVSPGSIIVFHDSVKAFKNMEFALPRTLEFLAANGYQCEALTAARVPAR